MSIRSVAVIGAGPCGAGLTRALLAEKAFSNITVFERRDRLGGLWNYTREKSLIPSITPVPSVDPLRPIGKIQAGGKSFYESPVYKYLDANVPKDLMAYKDFPFPKEVPLFPLQEQILEYIQGYSKKIEEYVRFDTEVTSVNWLTDDNQWEVKSRSLDTDLITTEKYDAVAIAVGSYDQPYIPDVPGISQWGTDHPGSIIHAKTYDEPSQFSKSRNILVVGNSASGADIAYQLATMLDKTIYKSVRSENILPSGSDERVKEVGDLESFDSKTQTVHFKDGTSLTNVDSVIFCTGYLKSIPFIHTSPPLITNGQKVHGLYRHLLWYRNPTLAVVGLPKFVLPTRLSETQGCWLARLWSGRLATPSYEEMKKDAESAEGEERNHHDLRYPKDVDYKNMLYKESESVEGDYGYKAVFWDEEQCRIRANIKPLKEGYIKYRSDTGKLASSIKELEDAGYFKWEVPV
uniref:Flavin-containing monooxygenase n=1 Tax=Cyberlindnera americana TaxID=36016 RepID=A0A5P8N993_9ASCO|nr:flavin-containing monooxygenase [Cyberlindnera americana]